jgi:hypothetical protein
VSANSKSYGDDALVLQETAMEASLEPHLQCSKYLRACSILSNIPSVPKYLSLEHFVHELRNVVNFVFCIGKRNYELQYFTKLFVIFVIVSKSDYTYCEGMPSMATPYAAMVCLYGGFLAFCHPPSTTLAYIFTSQSSQIIKIRGVLVTLSFEHTLEYSLSNWVKLV